MKLIVVQTLDNQVLDKEIDDIKQIKKFLYLLEENNLQVKDDILYFIDYGVHKVSKVNINFIYDSKFINIYKALKKNNYLKDYVLDYLSEYHVDIEQEQVIPQQFNNFNQRVNSKYKYGSVFKKIKKQQFLEDGNIDKLYNIDPLPKKPYFIWLVEQYKSGKLLSEDFFKAEELLEQFSNKRLRSDLKKNGYPVKIEHYDSINDLFSAINSLDDSIDHELDKKYALVLARKVAENDDWIISVPKTHEESVLISRYGGMTNWCTAADSEDGKDSFILHTNGGNDSLFICINKNDPEEKYQLNISMDGDFEFMDEVNDPVDTKSKKPDFIDLLYEPKIFNELYFDTSIEAGLYEQQLPQIINGICKHYYRPKSLDELNEIFSECLTFRQLDLDGLAIRELPDGLTIEGSLDLIKQTEIYELPDNLTIGGDLELYDSNIEKLGNGLSIGGTLYLSDDKISELPNDLKIGGCFYLNCSTSRIKKLPDNFSINGNLNLANNRSLRELPEELYVGGSLNISNTKILKLPNDLTVVNNLDIKNTQISELPNGLKVGKILYLSGTNITKLPDDLQVGLDIVWNRY